MASISYCSSSSSSATISVFVLFSLLFHDSLQQIRFVDTENTDQIASPENDKTSYFNNNPHNFNELPPNASIPDPNSSEVTSEINEPDGNRTGILQWILGIAGITPRPSPEELTPPENCTQCVCGLTNKYNRIVGGQETQINEYPWMTLLKYGSKFYCGAALISDKYVLTAAHCVQGFDANRITAVFLEHDRTKANETNLMKRRIVRATKHPQYNNRNYDNDIALLKLNESVPMDSSIRPVCLPPVQKTFAGQEGIVTGWGAIEEGGPLASKLQEVTVPIISNDDCKKTAYGPNRITSNMMCAGFPEGMKDSCQGDSGGPMHVVIDEKYFEAGVVSWGQGCAQKDYPGVYTRVNHYREWIKSNTRDACYCEATKK